MIEASARMDELWVCHLGHVPYSDGIAIQETLRARRQAGALPDTLLLLEHPPTYTRGRRSGAEDLPFDDRHYRNLGIDVFDADRGGQVTYHGPGQLVGYTIMRLDDVGDFLRTMEGAIMTALAEVGIAARSRHQEGIAYTGVWVEDRKIASIGLHVSRGISTHGFAVNVENDLDPFSWIVACGLPQVQMTSVAAELARLNPQHADHDSATSGADCSIDCFRKRMADHFARAHGARQRLVSTDRLGIATANATGLAERAPLNTSTSNQREPVPA